MTDNRILTTHAGSLPRTNQLRALLAARSKGQSIDEAALAHAVDVATRETVARQLQVGLDIINDGEQSRESFFTYVQYRMTGFGGTSERPMMKDRLHFKDFSENALRQATAPERVSLFTAPRVQSAVTYTDAGRGAIAADCLRFQQALDGHDGYVSAFMTAASPGIIAAAMDNDHYPTMEAYINALAAALATEYQAIIDTGFLLQIDAPDLAMERHTYFQDRPLADFLEFANNVITAINTALKDIPKDKVRLHICWGNYEGPHIFDVPLDDIWPAVVQAHAGGLLLSMANPRHAHEYHHFEANDLPDNCNLIVGVIDTTTNYVEHPKVVAERIVRAARAVGDPTRIIAGTDCGFEKAAGFQSVADDVTWAKLEALTEGAILASQDLF